MKRLLDPVICRQCGHPGLTWRDRHCTACGTDDFVPISANDGVMPVVLQVVVAVIILVWVSRGVFW